MTAARGTLILLVVLALLGGASMFLLPLDVLLWIGRENAPVETTSALLHAGWAAALAFAPRRWAWFHLSVIGVLLAEREADFDNLPETNVVRQLYEVVHSEPVIAGGQVVLIAIGLWLVLSVLLADVRPFLRHVRRRTPEALAILVGLTAAAVGQLLEEISLTLDLGHEERRLPALLRAAEEYAELLFAMFVAAAAATFLMKQRFRGLSAWQTDRRGADR